MGRYRSAGVGLGRYRPGVASDGTVAGGSSGGLSGTGPSGTGSAGPADPPARRGSQTAHGAGSDAEGRFGATGQADQSGRTGFAVALDLQEHPPLGGGAVAAGAPGEPYGGGGIAPRAGLYSLQGDRKVREGGTEPDRDAQFAYLNAEVTRFQAEGPPVVSVDAKKRELVGNFKNAGREGYPLGAAPAVNVYDFPTLGQGKAIPYGVYDLGRNAGWVNVGTDHDTAVFAVASLRQWWETLGRATYPQATRLLITADGGGSNSSRNHLWKWELQRWADQSGLTIQVCHFPPGTSKWNQIEHRLFSAITQNWRGQPLVSYETLVQLIGATHTRTGLTVQATLDAHAYPTGIKISNEQMTHVHLQKADFHGEWNYTILPMTSDKT